MDNSASAQQQIWYNVFLPSENEVTKIEEAPTSQFLETFKSALVAKAHLGNRLFNPLGRHSPCIRKLTNVNTETAWPLSELSVNWQLPDASEIHRLRDNCLIRFRSQYPPLADLSSDQLDSVSPPLKFALASLGAALLKSSWQKQLWMYTNYLLIAGFFVDATLTRNHLTYLAWVLNETAAVTAGDGDIQRSASMTNGFLETAMRRTRKAQLGQPGEEQPHNPVNPSLLSLILQNDLVRSLRFNTMPTVAASLGGFQVQQCSNQTLTGLAVEIFDTNKLQWDFDNPSLALTKMLLILNDIIISCRLPGSSGKMPGLDSTKVSLSTLSLAEEARESSHRNKRALDDWFSCYYQQVHVELRVLYHFGSMLSVAPGVCLVGRPNGTNADGMDQGTRSYDSSQNDLSRAQIGSNLTNQLGNHLYEEDALKHAVHHAWQVLESVSNLAPDSPVLSCVYLPVAMFTAAVSVWKNLVVDRHAGVPGSLRVLRLFAMELERMPWPCCETMIDVIRELS